MTTLTGRSVQNFRCYHDWHHGRSMSDWLGRSDLTVMTMLHDPVKRVGSAFKFRQRKIAAKPARLKSRILDNGGMVLPEVDIHGQA